jgi:hypothetical protein
MYTNAPMVQCSDALRCLFRFDYSTVNTVDIVQQQNIFFFLTKKFAVTGSNKNLRCYVVINC